MPKPGSRHGVEFDSAVEYDSPPYSPHSNFHTTWVSFENARLVFRDPFGVGYLDDREDYGEERWIRIGMIQVGKEQMIVTVVYTEREGRKRIISNWKATRDEQDDYFQQNASA